MKPEITNSRFVTSKVKSDICHSDKAVRKKPASIIARGSTLLSIRPAIPMASIVPIPRGTIRRPVSMTG